MFRELRNSSRRSYGMLLQASSEQFGAVYGTFSERTPRRLWIPSRDVLLDVARMMGLELTGGVPIASKLFLGEVPGAAPELLRSSSERVFGMFSERTPRRLWIPSRDVPLDVARMMERDDDWMCSESFKTPLVEVTKSLSGYFFEAIGRWSSECSLNGLRISAAMYGGRLRDWSWERIQ